MRFLEERREGKLPGLLYTDDLVVCDESEEDLRVMVGRFVEMCRRRLKVNADKSKVRVLKGEERLECEVYGDGIRLEQVSEFKYLGCVLDEYGTDEAECSMKVASGRRIVGAIRSLVNARDLQLECDRILHETLLVPVLIHGSETMLWKEKRSRIMAVQMNNLRGLLGIKMMDRVPNVHIRESYRMTKGLDERIDEGVLRWFDHVEKMKNDRIAKRIYVGECAGSRSVDRPRKRWIDSVKDFLRKRDLDVR